MQDLIATAQAAAPAAQPPKREKKERISKKLRQAIDLLINNKDITQKEAAERVGMHEATLCKALKKPTTRVFLAQRARENLSIGAARASNVMLELMECDANGVRFDASRFVLGVEGIKPAHDAQVSVSVDIKAGFVIDLSEPGATRSRSEPGTDAKVINGLADETG